MRLRYLPQPHRCHLNDFDTGFESSWTRIQAVAVARRLRCTETGRLAGFRTPVVRECFVAEGALQLELVRICETLTSVRAMMMGGLGRIAVAIVVVASLQGADAFLACPAAFRCGMKPTSTPFASPLSIS